MAIIVALAVILGAAIGRHLAPVDWPAIALAVLICLVIAIGCATLRLPGMALAAGIAAAAWTGWVIDTRLEAAASFPPGSLVVARGYVADTPVERDTYESARLTVYAIRRGDDWQEQELTLAVRAAPGIAFQPGEHLEVAGWVVEPRSSAEQRSVLRQHEAGVAAVIERSRVSRLEPGDPSLVAWLLGTRARLAAAMRAGLPEPQAALATGILLGDRSQIPLSLRQSFNDVGVSHLIAISGYNVAIVVALVVALLCAGLGRRLAMVIAVPTIVVYAVLVGGTPSVTRATAMGILFLLGLMLGREPHLWTSLAVATAVLVVTEPSLLSDIGFQLSVVATAGVAAAAPLASRAVGTPVARPWHRLIGVVVASFIVTIAATIATAPIIATEFARLSIVAPFANLAIEWVMPPIMATSLLVGVIGSVAPSLAGIAGSLAWPFLSYFVAASEALASLPLASVPTGSVPPWLGASAYAAAFCVLIVGDRRQDFGPLARVGQAAIHRAAGSAFGIAVPVLGVIALGAWSAAVTSVDPGPIARFLDVPGDAVLVQSGGRVILLDGGASPSELVAALGEHLPFGQRQIDLVVLTGLTAERTRGLRGLTERYRVAAFLAPDASESLARDVFGSTGSLPDVIAARPGQRVLLPGSEVALDILERGDPEQASGGGGLLVRIHSPRISLLLGGAASADALQRAANNNLELEADIARIPQGDSRAEQLWPELRRLVRPRLEVRRASQPGETWPTPTHRLGMDGPLLIALD